MTCTAPKSCVLNLHKMFIFRLLSKIRFSISLSFICGLAIKSPTSHLSGVLGSHLYVLPFGTLPASII